VVLLFPRTGYDFGFGLAPPHGLLALSAYLRAAAVPNRVVVIDQRVERDWRGLLLRELQARPLLVGISSMTGVQLRHALALARLVREHSPATPVVFGGVHVSLLPEQTLRCESIDMGIVGEGEEPLRALVQALNDRDDVARARIPGLAWKEGGRVVVNPRGPPPDLSALPVDRFAGIEVERYVFRRGALTSGRELDLGETSRGCFRQCAYCYNTVFNEGRWRGLDADATVAMIRRHVEAYRLESVWLRDDNFFADVDRAAKVIEGVARSGICLYLPGITIQEFKRLTPETLRALGGMGAQLRFGVESGSEDVLRLIRKGIHPEEVHEVNRECARYGLVPSYNFMVGFPGERRADVIATVRMMKRLRRENPAAQLNAVNLYTPYPGTALFERYLAEDPAGVPSTVEEWTTFHHLNVKRGGVGRSERRLYENVVTSSYVLSDTFGRSLPHHLRLLLAPLRLWLALRWRLEAFTLAPEILLLRKLKKIFLSIE
jgi:radical SAM superfamily enzyme YgiQ (UPF0313 family)